MLFPPSPQMPRQLQGRPFYTRWNDPNHQIPEYLNRPFPANNSGAPSQAPISLKQGESQPGAEIPTPLTKTESTTLAQDDDQVEKKESTLPKTKNFKQRLPRTAIHQLVHEMVSAILKETGRLPGALYLMNKMQNAAKANDPEHGLLVGWGPNYVEWETSNGKKKKFSMDACRKALDAFKKNQGI